MMIGKTFGHINSCSKLTYAFFKTFRTRNAADGTYVMAFEVVYGKTLSTSNILPISWRMTAFDNVGCAIEASDAGEEFLIGIGGALGDDDVGGAAQIGRWLAEGAAREEVFVAEGGLTIYEHDVHAMAQALVLKSIIQEQNIAVELTQGEESAFDAILINQYTNTREIFCQHMRLITCVARVEKHALTIGYDAGREEFVILKKFGAEALEKRTWNAFITSAKNGDAPPAFLQ